MLAEQLRKAVEAVMGSSTALLTKADIMEERLRRGIVIEPLLHDISTCSVDIRLDNYFGLFVSTGEAALDPGKRSRAIRFEEVPFFSTPFYVQPGTFVLGQTLEFVAIRKGLVAHLDGKSSLARRGLVVHATAGWIDPGWEGHITLELANLGAMPLALYPGMRVGRLVFQRVKEGDGYSGQFFGQLRIKEPAIDQDCERISAYASRIREERPAVS
jgi:dCTP deaminase